MMSSVDLLQELKLSDYYPRKLSYHQAIELRGKCQNGKPKEYGLDIVRKLLMFDHTAVVSATTEINHRLTNKGKTYLKSEAYTKAASGITPTSKSRPSWMSKNAEQRPQILHPTDVLVAIINCCDDLLRQILVENMVVNKLSIPILLPDVKSGSHTVLLLALRSLFSEVRNSSCGEMTDTMVDVKCPVVSFIRVGDHHRSKSKLINDLLNVNSFNTFFHRDCPNGSARRSISNGSIEAAWFQSELESENDFNCRFLTVLNLRGNARDYPKQTQFLCLASTIVVIVVDSFESFKGFYEKVLKGNIELIQTNIIIAYSSPDSPNNIVEEYFQFLDELTERRLISAVLYDWGDNGEKMNDSDWMDVVSNEISRLLKNENSERFRSFATIARDGKACDFCLDVDICEYKDGKAKADEFVNSILSLTSDCKPKLLLLQGEPWKKIGELEREQRRQKGETFHDESFIAEKEAEKRRHRLTQCMHLMLESNPVTALSENLISLHCDTILQSIVDENLVSSKQETLLHCLNSCKISLDARSRFILSNLTDEYTIALQEKRPTSSEEEPEIKLRKMELRISNSVIGFEHIFREHGQMYEAVKSEESRLGKELQAMSLNPDKIKSFPSLAATLLLMGHPLELMDGDASNVPTVWLKAVFDHITNITNMEKVFVVSIIGIQSSGKSTLLNALFGLQLPVSAGRCTRGIFCHLVRLDKRSLKAEYDYLLVLDTEGLRCSQVTGKSTFRDNELATFAIGLADATIINVKGENWAEMGDILQIVAHGLIRVRKTKTEIEMMPSCILVHQNVPAADAKEKNRLGQEKQFQALNNATKAAAIQEGFTDITSFNQVIMYDQANLSWYFPDLWNGRPPKARISQGYIDTANELREYLMQLMKESSSKLTISGFFLRLSDLWNAILHNDFVLCFRNTQEIISCTHLNDRIFHEMEGFKNQNKSKQTELSKIICSCVSTEELKAEKDRILTELNDFVEENFTKMKNTLQGIINAIDICTDSKKKYEYSLHALKVGELRRITDETVKK